MNAKELYCHRCGSPMRKVECKKVLFYDVFTREPIYNANYICIKTENELLPHYLVENIL